MTDAEEFTDDTLFDGDLYCRQYRRGYRFSVDSVLLAHFAEVRKPVRCLDLGTGSGIVLLVMLYRHRDLLHDCIGIELQPELAELAEHNLRANDYDDKTNIISADIKEMSRAVQAESFDLVLCNPPFFSAGAGRKSCGDQAMIARHQVSAQLTDFLRAAAFAVRNKGDVCFIYPADKMGELIVAAAACRLTLKTFRFVFSYPEQQAPKLVLMHFIKNGGDGTVICNPLYIYEEKNGEYSAEMESYFAKEKRG